MYSLTRRAAGGSVPRMPAYVERVSIDWHYERAPAAARDAIQRAHVELSDDQHTYDTFKRDLAAFATSWRTVTADALLEDGYRVLWLYTVRAGRVTEQEVFDQDKPWDSVISVDDDVLPLAYETEDEMRAAVKRAAARGATGACVAAVGARRFHVKIAKRMSITELKPLIDSAQYLRLATGAYEAPPAPAPEPRDPTFKYKCTYRFTEAMVAFVQEQAVRIDASLSKIVQSAWPFARAAIAAANIEGVRAAARTFGGKPRAQSLYYPGDILGEMEAEAARLHVPVDTIITAAVAIARPRLAELPEQTFD